MARVPTYESFKVAPSALSGGQFQPVRSSSFQDASGQQMQQLGQQMQQVGGMAANLSVELAREANQTRVNDALNQIKERSLFLTYDQESGYQNIKGFNALERPDGKDLASEYGDSLQQYINQVSGKLGNDIQRELFNEHAGRLRTDFVGSVQRHSANEYRNYEASVADGTISNALNAIPLEWRDSEKVEQNINLMNQALYKKAQITGMSAEQFEYESKRLQSQAHKMAIGQALDEGDSLSAWNYFDKNKGGMTAGDILDARNGITRIVDYQTGTDIAAQTFQSYSRQLETSPVDQVYNVAFLLSDGLEMKGVEYPEGATDQEKNKLATEEVERLIKQHDGKTDAVFGSLYAGEKEVSDLMEEHGTEWLKAAPEDLQKFVQEASKQFGSGGGKYRKPSLSEMKQSMRENSLLNNPARVKQAEAHIEKLYKEYNDADKQRKEELTNAIFQELRTNGGDLGAIPASLLNQLSSQQLNSATSYAGQVIRVNPNENPNKAKYAEMRGLSQDVLANMTPDSFLKEYGAFLSNEQLKEGYGYIDAARKAAGKDGATSADMIKGIEIESIQNMTNAAAIRMGIVPNKPQTKWKQEDFERKYEFMRRLDGLVKGREVELNRKLSSVEYREILDRVEAERVLLPSALGFGWGSSEYYLYELESDKDRARAVIEIEIEGKKHRVKHSDIDQAQRSAIIDSLVKLGNARPNEADIAKQYVKVLEWQKQKKENR